MSKLFYHLHRLRVEIDWYVFYSGHGVCNGVVGVHAWMPINKYSVVVAFFHVFDPSFISSTPCPCHRTPMIAHESHRQSVAGLLGRFVSSMLECAFARNLPQSFLRTVWDLMFMVGWATGREPGWLLRPVTSWSLC